MRYPVPARYLPRVCYAMSGTELAYGATDGGVACTVLSPYAPAMRCPVLMERTVYGAIALRRRYGVSGTERAYGATGRGGGVGLYCHWYLPTRVLRACYAMCGTDVAYGATSAHGVHAPRQHYPPRYRPTELL
eukprot:412478-Rhodomonas_salina.1